MPMIPTHVNVVENTGGARTFQTQVMDGEREPTACLNLQLPATHAAVRVQVGVVGRGDGSRRSIQLSSTGCTEGQR